MLWFAEAQGGLTRVKGGHVAQQGRWCPIEQHLVSVAFVPESNPQRLEASTRFHWPVCALAAVDRG